MLRTLFVCLALFCAPLSAAQTYMKSADFVDQAFAGTPPASQTIWLIENLGKKAEQVLGHSPNQLRERYWRKGSRSVWILAEVGKERPITTGWIVDNHKLVESKVLVYREPRGGEVRYPFFTQQFQGAGLNQSMDLDRSIDGISGATLSVGAMRRMAALALLLDAHTAENDAP